MRLSTVFELLLIFLLIAFAAYGRVIDPDEPLQRVARATKQNFDVSFMSLKQATENVNRYCTCNENICNCCRKFHIPLVRLRGPGCVSLQYLKENNLAVQLSYGGNILMSRIISGKKPQAICVPMPGGLTKFCSRIYSIEREADNHFKACLGLELQSGSDLEASLRVSCFRFGPEGLQLRPAESLPTIETPVPVDDDDDDDYDIFGLEDDSDENPPAKGPEGQQSSDDDDDDDDDDEDVLGFGELIDIFTGDDDSDKKKVTTAAPLVPFTIPLITKPTSTSPPPPQMKPVKQKPETGDIPLETKNPTKLPEVLTSVSETVGTTELSVKVDPTEPGEESTADEDLEDPTEEPLEESTSTPDERPEEKPEEEPEDIEILEDVTPQVVSTAPTVTKTSGVKKIVGIKTVKKPSLTSNSPNAIKIDSKPVVKPLGKPDPNSEEEEEDYILASNSEEDDELENTEDDETEDEGEVEDDSDEEEDAVLSALVADDNKDKHHKISDNETSNPEDDDADYGMGLEELLARRRSSRRQWTGRQSKVMRL
ncbi:probable ATP-dependent RNA helicase ddx10 [Fopius arisanus]|uniref:Probable ATP-dependent RNA helicase ddx10 n=1 Tax=Fopius arisanus TaxID=64838 RepID=A0A0C9RQY1_9HYME|nr:PREDICTED: probable ATP-dependent RNA helicase ddx10 [Fopius arisanus]